ncbi:MAG: NAD(P)-binding domain-containing protein [Armatimonadetes bacterium]|nr:NAD(P)-binding domain-containing protein [Armatimonadota bacterium]
MKVALLGAGGYGTALLRPLTDNGHTVHLWDRNAELLAEIARRGYNPRYPYLHDFPLPETVLPTPDLVHALADAEAVVSAVSIAGLSEVYRALAEVWPGDQPLTLIGISKGITPQGQLPDELVRQAFIDRTVRYVHLAGPAFAQDLIHRAPVALVAASPHPESVAACRKLFGNPYVWVYATDDLRGIEAAAAVRTILSFVFGGIAGIGGVARSTKAFIFSRAQAEIARFGIAMGGQSETFGMDSPCAPATLGDLYLCDDPGSRNWQLGHKVAQGKGIREALGELQGVAECVTNALVVHRISEAFRERDPGWQLPWCEGVYRVCHENAEVESVMKAIQARAERLQAYKK